MRLLYWRALKKNKLSKNGEPESWFHSENANSANFCSLSSRLPFISSEGKKQNKTITSLSLLNAAIFEREILSPPLPVFCIIAAKEPSLNLCKRLF